MGYFWAKMRICMGTTRNNFKGQISNSDLESRGQIRPIPFSILISFLGNFCLGSLLGPPIRNNGAISGSFGQKCQFAWELPLIITYNGKFQPRISNLEVK